MLILRRLYLGIQVLAWYIDPNDIEEKYSVKYTCSTDIKKCEILITDTQMVSEKTIPIPTLVIDTLLAVAVDI
jgi:hypothetical protein